MCKKIKVHQASQERNQLSPRKLVRSLADAAELVKKNNGHWVHQSGQ